MYTNYNYHEIKNILIDNIISITMILNYKTSLVEQGDCGDDNGN